MISTTTLKLLLDAGQSNEWLLAVTAAFEADVNTVRELLREQFRTVDAGEPTPAALRMRKIRENKRLLKEQEALKDCVTDANTVREPCVTSYNILTLSKGVEKEESKPVVIARGRKKPDYPDDYEDFWEAYPTDKGMSKSEGFKAWKNLSEDDRKLARSAIGAFKGWVVDQGPTYRVVHACRYLSQRRFDGFKPETERPANSSAWTAEPGSPEWEAWEAFWLKTKGHKPPRNLRGSWTFPSQWPPEQNERAA